MAVNIFEKERNKISTDLTSYNFLLYSESGLGKTTFAVDLFPDRSFILGFEDGFKGIPNALGVSVPSYLELLAYIDQLDTDEARERWDTIIVDTTTKGGEVVENYICSMFGKNFIGDCKTRGGAYPLVNRYWNMAFDRLKARGYNFVYICHSRTLEVKNEKDEVVGLRHIPKMSDRISGLIEPEVDYVLFLTLNNEGERIIVTDNTPKNKGKQRTDLPLIMPLDAENFKKELERGISKKGGANVTNTRRNTTVVQAMQKERDYKEIVAEIKAIGKKVCDTSEELGKQANSMLSNRLGKNDDGVQRTLDEMTQENAEMLEVALLDLKKLIA